jgi:hypothetical protein
MKKAQNRDILPRSSYMWDKGTRGQRSAAATAIAALTGSNQA